MIVIAKNAEKRLLLEMQHFDEEDSSLKCFYLGLSKSDIPKQELLGAFLKLLNELPESYVAQVYICNDKDVFILVRGFMQRQFEDFVTKLAREFQSEELLALADVFDAGPHKYKIEALCSSKMAAAEEAEAERLESERKEGADRSTLEALEQLDPALLATIAERRRNRREPMVMIVEDDQITRTLVGNVLQNDYLLAFGANGKEAISSYAKSAPDAVFLDIGLPDMNGVEGLGCIFQMDPNAYVIMFSGMKDKSHIMRALDIGAEGFVGKPFTRDKMFQYIHKSPYIKEKQQARDTAYGRTAM